MTNIIYEGISMDMMELKKVYLLIVLSLFYLTLSLACDPLCFRIVNIHGYNFTGSAIIFPILYVVLDSITRVCGKYMAIRLVFLFHIFDGVFTYLLYTINLLPSPPLFSHLNAFLIVVSPLPRLFWSGILGAILAGITEVLLYAFLQNKIKSFFLASVTSTILILLAHDLATDYMAFYKIFPSSYWRLTFANFSIGSISVIISSMIISMILLYRREFYGLLSKTN